MIYFCEVGFLRGIVNEDFFNELRTKMVREQLRSRDITDTTVLAALEKVKRHLFVSEENRIYSYEDRPLSIGFGQTISQPYIVSLMVQILQLKPGEKVLEIGTGSGYQSAILSEIGAETFTIEIVPELTQLALSNLGSAQYFNVATKTGDGSQGWAEFAPYDAILVSCAAIQTPQPLLDQLKNSGRMVIPIGEENKVQSLTTVSMNQGAIKTEIGAPVRFVPMTRPQLQ